MTPSIKWFLLGFLSILFGIFAINHALLTSIAVTVLVGAMLVLSGVAQVVLGVNEDGIWRKLLSIGLGTLLVALGISFLVTPMDGVISLALLVTLLVGAGGLLRFALAFQLRRTHFFWITLISGALSVCLAIYIFLIPLALASFLGLLIGIEMVLNGVGLVALGFTMRVHARTI